MLTPRRLLENCRKLSERAAGGANNYREMSRQIGLRRTGGCMRATALPHNCFGEQFRALSTCRPHSFDRTRPMWANFAVASKTWPILVEIRSLAQFGQRRNMVPRAAGIAKATLLDKGTSRRPTSFPEWVRRAPHLTNFAACCASLCRRISRKSVKSGSLLHFPRRHSRPLNKSRTGTSNRQSDTRQTLGASSPTGAAPTDGPQPIGHG